MPQLDPTWFASELFWLVICFSVLYLLLSRLILPPLQGVITLRKNAVDGDLLAAQEFKLQAETARQSYEKTAADARNNAQNLMSEAEANSKEQAVQASKALDAQVATQIANAAKNITAKKQEMLSALSPKVSDFSAQIAEKLTAHTPTEDMVKRAIQSMN